MTELKDTIDNGETEVQVATIGTVIGTGKNGEPVEQHLTEKALKELAEKHKDEELLVDADHESEIGGKTEAKGWLSGLNFVPGVGLFGKIKWTDIGRKLIENRVFRWLSPSWYLNKETKEPIQMTSVALTNKPSQAGKIEPIVNSAPIELNNNYNTETITMEMTKEELIELIKQTIIDLKKEKKVEELDKAIENENEVHEDIVENLEDEKKAIETGTVPVDALNSASNTCGKTEEKVENECGKKAEVTKNEDTVEKEVKEELKEGTEDDKTEDVKKEVKEEIKEEKEEEKEDKKEEKEEDKEEKEEVIKIDALNSTPKTFGFDIIKNTGKSAPSYPGEGYAVVTKMN